MDPVRFIGNASSGLMGKAIAEEALRRGWYIEFVTGPVTPSHLPDLGEHGAVHKIISAEEMLSRARTLFSTCQLAIFAAAVADYAPRIRHSEKITKSEQELVLHLRLNPDIAKTLCAHKAEDQLAIGFALQTSDGEQNARRKLQEKNLDGIVLNSPATLSASDGTFSFLGRDFPEFVHWGRIDKAECARRILDAVEHMQPN